MSRTQIVLLHMCSSVMMFSRCLLVGSQTTVSTEADSTLQPQMPPDGTPSNGEAEIFQVVCCFKITHLFTRSVGTCECMIVCVRACVCVVLICVCTCGLYVVYLSAL